MTIIGWPFLRHCDYCGKEHSCGSHIEGIGTHRILVRGEFCSAECQEASECEIGETTLISLVCKDCGNKTFYRTGGQLHSDPPWDIFGCKECLSCWAVNCGWIYGHDGDTVVYDKRGTVRSEGKPFSFTDKEGRAWYMNGPPGIPPRSYEEYENYRKPNGGPAVGNYEVLKI